MSAKRKHQPPFDLKAFLDEGRFLNFSIRYVRALATTHSGDASRLRHGRPARVRDSPAQKRHFDITDKFATFAPCPLAGHGLGERFPGRPTTPTS
jgi:hypothetical protein